MALKYVYPQLVPRDAWPNFFTFVNKLMVGHPVEVEIASLAIGDQIADEWVPLAGMTYDQKRDVVHVQTDPIDHLIPRPREVGVEQIGTEIRTIIIQNAWGELQIIRFREPFLLVAPVAKPD